MLSDDGPRRSRALVKALSEDALLPRIPPNSEKLFENLPWASIMADIAIAAAVAEIKVNFFFKFSSWWSVLASRGHDRSPGLRLIGNAENIC